MPSVERLARSAVRCPKCGYVPSDRDLWLCAPDGCGTTWNTFETGAHCPGCGAHHPQTACPACAQWSPHSSWYPRR